VAVIGAAIGFARLDDPPRRPVRAGIPGPGPLPAPLATAAQAVLSDQDRAVLTRDRVGYLAGWQREPAAQRRAAFTYANLLRLGVPRIVARLSLASVRGQPSGWTARVDVTWRPDRRDASTVTTALRYTFSGGPQHPVIIGVHRVRGEHEPIWLLPNLDVRRGPRTLVAASSPGSASRIERLLRQAVTAIDRVLPGWHGRLVAYAPGSANQFAALLGARPHQNRGIAAVTTVVDGSSERAAPAAIVVNPDVFAGLGPISAHVVITHEATHLATGAAAVSMPLWVAEGFADYVGIGSVDLPVSVAARAALDAVRRDGPPATLPDDAAFALRGGGLEVTYEQAWLAAELIAQTYGTARLVAFYRAVQAHPNDLPGAFRQVLHTSVPAFTAAWKSSLREAAGAG